MEGCFQSQALPRLRSSCSWGCSYLKAQKGLLNLCPNSLTELSAGLGSLLFVCWLEASCLTRRTYHISEFTNEITLHRVWHFFFFLPRNMLHIFLLVIKHIHQFLRLWMQIVILKKKNSVRQISKNIMENLFHFIFFSLCTEIGKLHLPSGFWLLCFITIKKRKICVFT